mmetsp:Transcript_7456/g.27937  ORF Transcript_7456/g.27937 Transcript_7456/m.27937 type:complete len:412 (-) Transcript_7456:2024-3259(-)
MQLHPLSEGSFFVLFFTGDWAGVTQRVCDKMNSKVLVGELNKTFHTTMSSSATSSATKIAVFLIPVTLVLAYYFSGGILTLHKSLRGAINSDMEHYTTLYDESSGRDVSKRNDKYNEIVPNFYRLVTDFYEYGWGESFHFAPSRQSEDFGASLSRHEHYLAMKAGLREGMTVLDLGAGVGGPMREIARFANVSVIGINIVDYQITRGDQLNKKYQMDHLCSFKKADFHHLPFEDESVDAIYSIEAICHTTNKIKVFKEMNRVLKKGGRVAIYDWLMTDKYDPSNPIHNKIKEGIEIGNALPDILSYTTVKDQMEEAGFTVLEEKDVALVTRENPVPWYTPLGSSWSIRGVANSQLSRKVTNSVCWILEKIGLADKGSHYAAVMLDKTARDLVASGETGIFTPSYMVVAEKK